MSTSLASFMLAFYSTHQIEHLDARDTALAFARYCYNHRPSLSPDIQRSPQTINVAIADSYTSLPFLTKRGLLISDSTLISHRTPTLKAGNIWGSGWDGDVWSYFNSDEFRRNHHKIAEDFVGGLAVNTKIIHRYRMHDVYFVCPNITELGEWIKYTKEMQTDGNIFYLPYIFPHPNVQYYKAQQLSTPDTFFDVVVHNRCIVQRGTENAIKSKLFKKLFSFDLPIIENTDMETLCKISHDNREPFDNFRLFLQARLLEIQSAEGSNTPVEALERLSLEIRSGVNKLNSDIEKIRRKAAFQITGAGFATFTAILFAIHSMDISGLASVLGTGGALWLFKEIGEYAVKKGEPQESPYYYLWLLSKSRARR